ncbi:MAG: 30S ribosomal protein S1 [Acidobacteria bacterium]|nr:30S ribosomal protein S1 [Acidobacteriota bacterium]MBI3472804.1 30S ribosomal protein S1 [Candidatus Solibacter usitatus]
MSKQPVNPDEEVIISTFGDILSEYEQSHRAVREPGQEGRAGRVVAVSPEYVFVDIGLKTEGVIPAGDLAGAEFQPGDTVQVSVAGRHPEGYYLLSRIQVARPKDWSGLEKAFAEKRAIAGVVSGLVKGGFHVDVGVRAFMPASRSGARDQAEMEQLVGQEISCRVIKLDVGDEDVVVDRRAVLEDEERAARERIYTELQEGAVLRGQVRSLADYGAFIDIGGVDGLLHVGDMSWARIGKPADLLKVGDTVDVQVLKVDPAKKRISLGMKQLSADPWSLAAEKYQAGARVRGAVTRVADFGAFVELEPGLEGLIHLSELSWSKKVRKPADIIKAGETVEVVVLSVSASDRRIALGLKQALGDPWASIDTKYPEGSVVEGPVVSLAKFGAFVDLGDGIEGMIHVGDLSAEKRIEHPHDVLKMGQTVRAAVIGVDRERRRLRLGLKQLQPTSIDEYISEHKEGDVVTGRVARISGRDATVDLGDGIQAACPMPVDAGSESAGAGEAQSQGADLGSLTSMLAAKWKQGAPAGVVKRESARSGQIRSFRIVRLDAAKKRIELELAG